MINETLYDLSDLKVISRGNDLFIKQIIGIFCEQTPLLVSEMINCYHVQKLEEMGLIAHQLKPSLDSLNIISLKQVIRDIEASGKQGIDNPRLSEWLKTTETVTTIIIRQMRLEFLNI